MYDTGISRYVSCLHDTGIMPTPLMSPDTIDCEMQEIIWKEEIIKDIIE